jgi:hypothetical protein
VRFVITNDKLQMVNLREISHSQEVKAQGTRAFEVTSAWPVSHVDLKYRINLDGEKTNFYEENQELDWQLRQWVKVQLANNDIGEFAPWGQYMQYFMERCVDTAHVSRTLVPNSLRVDEKNDYLSWKVSVTLPVQFDDPACVQGYAEEGGHFQKLGRNQVSMTVMYSLARAPSAEKITYRPLALAEKDPIKRKYGPFGRSPSTATTTASSSRLGSSCGGTIRTKTSSTISHRAIRISTKSTFLARTESSSRRTRFSRPPESRGASW